MTDHQHPPDALAHLGAALPDLARRLREAGLPCSPDRWHNLHDLLLALAEQGRLPADPARLEARVAPLFCADEQDQRRFRVLFRAWAQAHPSPLARAQPAPPPMRLRGWLLLLALLLVAAVTGLYIYNETLPIEEPDTGQQQTPDPPLQQPDSLRERPPQPPQPDPAAADAAPLTIPPRLPPPPPALDPHHRGLLRFYGHLCLLLPPFVAGAWLLLSVITWRTVLARRRGDPNDPLLGVALKAGADDLLDTPALRETLRRLHAPVAWPTRRLDARATVERSARQAGLFEPVRRHRRGVPELVVLLEVHHAGDQMAGLAGQLVQRLRDAGLTVHRYDYRDGPERLVDAAGLPVALADVAARHAGARLLIVGEPLALMDPFAGRPRAFLGALDALPRRALLCTRRPPAAWERALGAAGLAVAEIGSDGIRELVLSLGGLRAPDAAAASPVPGAPEPAPASAPALPRAVQSAAELGDTPPATDERRALLTALDAFLGSDGAALLAAVAAYPQLHWGLTRVLDLNLFPADDAEPRERRLLALARLPWSRRGWLPDWLREALLERLPGRERRRLRRLYRDLLQARTAGVDAAFELPIALPERGGLLAGAWRWLCERGWRAGRWLAALRGLADDHGALNDAIFADVLFGWRIRLLDFTVARRLLRGHLGGALGRALMPRLLLALLLGCAGALLADRAWHGWIKDTHAHPYLLAGQQAMHHRYQVRIWHRPEAAALAAALRDTLQAEGFTAAIASEPLALPAGQAPPAAWINQLQLDPAADPHAGKMAEYISERVTWLSWGTPVTQSSPVQVWAGLAAFAEPPAARELRVLLATPGATRARFRDGLGRELSEAELAEFARMSNPSEVTEAVEGGAPRSRPRATEQSSEDVAPSGHLLSDDPSVEEGDSSEQARLDGRDSVDVDLSSPKVELTINDTLTTGAIDVGKDSYGNPRVLLRDTLKDGSPGPEMIMLPDGSFKMGSPPGEPARWDDEGPQREVRIAPFAIGRTEVTFAEYDRFAEATGRYKPYDSGWGRGDRPVINVSWNDAQAYAEWLSDQTGERYRLPTEAEWEYAARGGTTTPFWTGDCIHTGQANYNGNYDYNGCGARTGVHRAQTVPAGSLLPNAFGLHEVAGNVWEWVEDCLHGDYDGGPADGSAWRRADEVKCIRRVLRGGAWNDSASHLRSANRHSFHQTGENGHTGFRVARVL
ncbi:formylglycine-generating enzyme family protein [Thiohalocapsa sp. ML1]|uniref:formylglycine-generating enzyme family protein n=1 Tax=Thiohalocapsa sp. ML1 TaxID=1431688 RepID=UPI0007322315|nr:formylglycine-generating enzyme family protein [Thiohalocapsa sp. ML1]